MTLTVNTLRALAEGVAQRIAAKADPLLQVQWDPAGHYATGKIGIYLAVVPATPDQIISLSPRQLTADPTLADSEYALQARFRSIPNDPRPVWTLVSAVRDALLGVWPTVLSTGLTVTRVDFMGGTPIGMDPQNRLEWTDNYVFQVGEHRARPY